MKIKGVSETVSIALLILIAIAATATIWIFAQRFTQGGNVIQAQAILVSNRQVGANTSYIFDITLTNKSPNVLTLSNITLIGTFANGTSANIQLPANSISPPGTLTLNPNDQEHITITYSVASTNPLAEVSFLMVLKAASGNQYTVQTNSISVG